MNKTNIDESAVHQETMHYVETTTYYRLIQNIKFLATTFDVCKSF